LGVERVPFPIEVTEVKAGDTLKSAAARDGYDIHAFPTEHGGGPSIGYVLKEHERRGRFDVEKARALGIPEGPLWGKLTKGEAAQIALASKAKRLLLSHVSARYSISADELAKEAREVFPNASVAKDGMEVDVPFAE